MKLWKILLCIQIVKNIFIYLINKIRQRDKNVFLKEMTINEFSRRASNYDDTNNFIMVKDDYSSVVDEVSKEPFKTLIDCGCGTGNFISLLAEKYQNKRYIGIDISSYMIDKAQNKHIPNSTFIVNDCENIEISEGTADVVTCIHSFHHFPNPNKFFSDIYNTLSDRGRLIIRDNACSNTFQYWIKNHIIIPFYMNLMLNMGDVHFYNKKEMEKLCKIHRFKMEKFEVIKGDKMHCVMRKMY